jgi:hypothetical protein
VIRWSVLSILVAVLWINAAPDMEGYFFPVAREMGISITSRSETEICYELAFVKLREARPVSFAWMLYSRGAPWRRAAVTPVDPSSGFPMIAENTAPASREVVAYDRCVEVPEPLRGAPDLVLEAFGVYEVPGRPWRITRTIPPQSIGSTVVAISP